MLNDGLKKSIEDILKIEDLNISFKKNPMNSDGSFICLATHSLDQELIKEKLLSLKWIDQVTFNGSFLNFYLIKEPLVLEDIEVSNIKIKKPLRLYQLQNRLEAEIKVDALIYDDHWLPLIKVYNLCIVEIITLKKISESNMNALLKTFKSLDLGFMYRKHSKEILAGILEILKACISLIERTCDE